MSTPPTTDRHRHWADIPRDSRIYLNGKRLCLYLDPDKGEVVGRWHGPRCARPTCHAAEARIRTTRARQ